MYEMVCFGLWFWLLTQVNCRRQKSVCNEFQSTSCTIHSRRRTSRSIIMKPMSLRLASSFIALMDPPFIDPDPHRRSYQELPSHVSFHMLSSSWLKHFLLMGTRYEIKAMSWQCAVGSQSYRHAVTTDPSGIHTGKTPYNQKESHSRTLTMLAVLHEPLTHRSCCQYWCLHPFLFLCSTRLGVIYSVDRLILQGIYAHSNASDLNVTTRWDGPSCLIN